MALLGAQLVMTLIMVSVIQKLSPHYSLAKWILCSTGLIRFLHPTDNELKTLAGVPKSMHKTKKEHRHSKYSNGNDNEKSHTFHVPRNLDIQLEVTKVTPYDVINLRYYTEYQWLVDFSLYACIIYVISEIYHYYIPLREEVNLSMMWCLLVIFFAFKLLISLTVQYFKSDESIGERSTCIVTGLVYLLVAMIILIVDENTLEVGLEQAYKSFNESASVYLEERGVSSSGPASKIIVKFCIAVSCGILGAIFTFPGLRMARMHWDSLKYCRENKFLQFILNVSFVLPFIIVILWIKPISREYLTNRVFTGFNQPMLTPQAFDLIRFLLIIIAVVLRLVLMPIYLQAYLNLAYDRLEEQKKEAGRITNVDLQKKIASIFYYLCVVTLQYVAPILMCLYFALMYKTLGGYNWTDLFANNTSNVTITVPPKESIVITPLDEDGFQDGFQDDQIESLDKTILESAKELQSSFHGLKAVFTTDVYRGLFGFATWWTCFVWFAASSLGMVYQSYFTKL
ncbi:transmembrane protein 161B isoform X2 [Contarinia nasturtii]|nr:transmembrane protein 161B isoform X2 [Contarinia nasturtii]